MRHHAEKVEEYLPNTYYWFDQFDMPDLRAYAAHYFRQYPHAEMEKHLAAWKEDRRIAVLYLDGEVVQKKVCEMI